MLSKISFRGQPAPSKPPLPNEPISPEKGRLLLELLCDHSPAASEALEGESAGALPALMWASPYRTQFAETKKMDVDCPNPDGDTLWLRTAREGDFPKATYKLMRAGAKVDAKDENGMDALSINAALSHNKALSILEQTFTGPLSPHRQHRVHRPTTEGFSLIPEEKRLALQQKKLLHNRDHNGKTALMHAIEQNNPLGVCILSQQDKRINITDPQGQTLLMQAARTGNPYVGLHLLNRYAKTEWRDNQGKTALMHWLQEGLAKARQKRKTSESWLERAGSAMTLRKSPEMVFTKTLIERGHVQLNLPDNDGRTALHYLLANSSPLKADDQTIAHQLLKHNASVDAQDHEGMTPLMLIAAQKPNDSVEQDSLALAAIQACNRPNLQDSNGKTALHYALEAGNLPFAYAFLSLKGLHMPREFLLPEEAVMHVDVNVQDRQGNTPLMALAGLNPKAFELPSLRTPLQWLGLMFSSDKPYDLPIREHPLGMLAKTIVKQGANLRKINADGDTALTLAARSGNLPVLKALAEHLEKSAPQLVDDWNRHGYSPLQVAAKYNRPASVRELCMAGADVNRIAPNGKTAYQIAEENGSKAALDCLKALDGERNRGGKIIRL